jgi:hypothetical protein
METSQRSELKRRLVLLSILVVVGLVAATAIIALGANKAIPGTSKHYVSVVRRPLKPPLNQSNQQSQFHNLSKNLTAIAMKDEGVSALLAGRNYSVVGIAVPRPSLVPAGDHPPENAALFLKVDSRFYKIDIDIPHEKVTSVAERACYGPGCRG